MSLSDQFRQQLIVSFVLFQGGNESFHRFDRVQVHHGAAEFAHGLDLIFGEELFLFPRAAFRNVNRGEEPAI